MQVECHMILESQFQIRESKKKMRVCVCLGLCIGVSSLNCACGRESVRECQNKNDFLNKKKMRVFVCLGLRVGVLCLSCVCERESVRECVRERARESLSAGEGVRARESEWEKDCVTVP